MLVDATTRLPSIIQRNVVGFTLYLMNIGSAMARQSMNVIMNSLSLRTIITIDQVQSVVWASLHC